MDTRVVTDDSIAHQEAIKFFTKVLKEKLQDQSIVDVKYVQPHLGQANNNIQALLWVSYKNDLLSFFFDHPEAFAVYGQNVCLSKNTPLPTRGSVAPFSTSKMPTVNTEIEASFAEEAAIGFVAGAIHYRGPLSLDRLAGQCSRMSSEMQDFLNSQKGTGAVEKLLDVLSSRPHIFDISIGRTVSIVSKLPCIKEAEEKSLESMCRYLIGSTHLHLDTLLNKLQHQCNHLVLMVLNEVSQGDGLEEFLLTRRARFFVPELQDVWNIREADRLPLEMERMIVKFFKQEITRRGKGIHYVDLLKKFEKSNVVMEKKFKDSVQLAKVLWCHESELDFIEGIVLAVDSKDDDALGELCPPACRQDASQKVFRLYGSWLADYKGVISFASKHIMLIKATVEDSDSVETFEVYCHCKFCEFGNGTDPKADLCRFLRKGDEVIFNAIYDDSEYSENPNKLLWSAVHVTKALPERPDPPYQRSPIKNPAQGHVEKKDKKVSQPSIEKTSLEHVSDDTSRTLQAFISTGIVTIVGKNCGVLQIDQPSGTKSIYFELSKVETDVSSGLCNVEVGQSVEVEFENGEQSLPEATRVRLIPNLHEQSQNGAPPSGTEKLPASVTPSHSSQVKDRPVTPTNVKVAATARDSPDLYSAADDVMATSLTSSRESLAISPNPDIDLNLLNMSVAENTVLNVFSNGGQTMPNLGILPQDIQNRLVALISKELLDIAADDPVFSHAHRNSDCRIESGLMVSVACQTLSTGPLCEVAFTDS